LLLLFVLLSGALPFAACSAAVDRYLLVAAARFRAAEGASSRRQNSVAGSVNAVT